jgi:hypothetical protein
VVAVAAVAEIGAVAVEAGNSRSVEVFGIEVDSLAGLEVAVPSSCCTCLGGSSGSSTEGRKCEVEGVWSDKGVELNTGEIQRSKVGGEALIIAYVISPNLDL